MRLLYGGFQLSVDVQGGSGRAPLLNEAQAAKQAPHFFTSATFLSLLPSMFFMAIAARIRPKASRRSR
jgi:hypothetical protein